MDIKDGLLNDYSKEGVQKIAKYIGNDSERVEELMQLFLYDEKMICQRASWVVSYVADQYPDVFEPYLYAILENLKNPVHDAVKRNTIRIFQEVEIPEDLLGGVFEACYNYLIDPKEPIAPRVFSMTVLLHICRRIPELAEEVILAIEDHLPHGSAGFKSRGGKVLKELRKLIVKEE